MSQSSERLVLYLDGYIAALKDLRELLAESDTPPIRALCGALDDKLARMRRERRRLVGGGRRAA